MGNIQRFCGAAAALAALLATSNALAQAPEAPEAFVEYLYDNILLRDGDGAGTNYWSGFVTDGTLTEGQTANRFFADVGYAGSTEVLGTADLLNVLYGIDDQAPSPATLAGVKDTLETTGSFDDAFGPLFAGTGIDFAGDDNQTFVEGLYQLFYNRAGDPEGGAGWTAALDAGLSRGELVLAFATFPEADEVFGGDALVDYAYQIFTGRGATPTELMNANGTLSNAFLTALIEEGRNPPLAAFTLQLLHTADQEAGVAALDDAPRFSAVLNVLEADAAGVDGTLILSSGDAYIPGVFLTASADESLAPLLGVPGNARGDILIQNALGFQAIALGNHEFDFGPDFVFEIIAPEEGEDGTYPGAQFPYLSTNIDFTPETGTEEEPGLGSLVVEDGLDGATLTNAVAGYITLDAGGETFGVIGATTPTLEVISSTGDLVIAPQPFGAPATEEQLAALAAEIQPAVDDLRSQDIDKIILLAHMQQISVEYALATLLDGVDIIVAGGSNTILADATDRLRPGDTAAGDYPQQFTSSTGEPVLVVNTDGNYRYVGRLVIGFDANGVIVPSTYDTAVSGAYATDDQGLLDVNATLADADQAVIDITDALEAVIIATESNQFGATAVYLDGRRSEVRSEETNLGNLSADANLFVAQQVESNTALSLKNGGGIRDDIGEVVVPPGASGPEDTQFLPPAAIEAAGKEEGEISQTDIANALRFNNELTLVTVTAEELKALLENGVAGVAPGATPGAFPQVAGIQFSFDPGLEAGSRVQSLVVLDADGLDTTERDGLDIVVQGGQVQGDVDRTFRLVTLNFLAEGGDGYPFPMDEGANQLNLTTLDQQVLLELLGGEATFADAGSEQDALARYLANEFPLDTPFAEEEAAPADDERIQNLSVREDTVIPAER